MPTLPKPTIMLVTDRHACPPGELPARVAAAVAGGVNVVQLRDKDLPVGELLALGQAVKDAIAGRALFLVNDRVDVALALGADGVHLPQEGVPVSVAGVVSAPAMGTRWWAARCTRSRPRARPRWRAPTT